MGNPINSSKILTEKNQIPIPQESQPKKNLASSFVLEKERLSRSFYWGATLDAIIVLSAIIASYTLSLLYQAKISYWFPVVALSVFLIANIFGTLLSQSTSRRILILAISAAGLMSFFVDAKLSQISLGASIVLAVLFIWGDQAAQNQLKNSLRVQFLTTGKLLMTKMITGIVLAATIVLVGQMNGEEPVVSEQQFQTFLNGASGFLNGFSGPKGSDLGNFLEKQLENVVRSQLEKNPQWGKLTDRQKNELVAQAMKNILRSQSNEASLTSGNSATTEKIVGGWLYTLINTTLTSWKERFGTLFYIGWGVVLFFAARSAAWIASIAILIVGYLLYEFLIAIDVLTIKPKPETREIVEFKS